MTKKNDKTLQLIDLTKGMNVLKVTIEMIFSKTQKVVKPTEVHVHLFFNPTGTQKNISNYKSHKEMNKSLSHQGLAVLGNFLFIFFLNHQHCHQCYLQE